MSIREQAEQALARAEKATPGPWVSPWDSDPPGEDVPDKIALTNVLGNPVVCLAYHDGWHLGGTREDFALIAAARADVPALARFVLRVTGSEMRERVRLRIVEHLRATDPALAVRVAATFGDTAGSNIADAIMALLLETP